MKLIELSGYDNEDLYYTFGIHWVECYDRPFMSIEKPNRIYYHYMVFVFCFNKYQKALTIRLNKMPYKNKAEYLIWLKDYRKQQVK